MPEPKKSPTKRRQGNRRSQIGLKLARRVNAKSPVKVFTTRRETPNLANNKSKKSASKLADKSAAKSKTKAKTNAKKAAPKKIAAKKSTKK